MKTGCSTVDIQVEARTWPTIELPGANVIEPQMIASYAEDACIDRANCYFFPIRWKWKDAAQALIMSSKYKKSTATLNMLEERTGYPQ